MYIKWFTKGELYSKKFNEWSRINQSFIIVYSWQKLGLTSYIDKDLWLQVQMLWSFYLSIREKDKKNLK